MAEGRAAVEPGQANTGRQRVLTLPLAAFLLAVVAVLGTALWERSRAPGPGQAIAQLGDGDLDGDERARTLRALLDAGRDSGVLTERWGALLAAIALEDRSAYDAVRATLGAPGPTAKVPPAAERELLHLGDPLLGNMLGALVAEAEGPPDEAVRRWRQVAAQCRLMPRPFARELADEALRRLR